MFFFVVVAVVETKLSSALLRISYFFMLHLNIKDCQICCKVGLLSSQQNWSLAYGLSNWFTHKHVESVVREHRGTLSCQNRAMLSKTVF